MKKAFKIVSTVMLIIAMVAFGVSIVLPGMIGDKSELAFFSLIMVNAGIVVFVMVGAFLTMSKNNTANKVGHGLLIAGFIIGFADALMSIEEGCSCIVMVVAVGFLALHYIFELVVSILNKGSKTITNPDEDARIIQIKAWKQLMEEGIISAEEYEEKRIAILDIKPKTDKPDKE